MSGSELECILESLEDCQKFLIFLSPMEDWGLSGLRWGLGLGRVKKGSPGDSNGQTSRGNHCFKFFISQMRQGCAKK